MRLTRSAVGAWFAVRFALGSLRQYRLRSLLTALGVTMGVSTVIAIVAIVEGLDRSFRDSVSAIGTGTVYLSYRPWIIFGDWWKYRNRPPIQSKDAQYLEDRLTLSKAVVPFARHRVSIELGKTRLTNVRVIGTTSDWPVMSGVSPESGRFFGPMDLRAGRPVVALGSDVVTNLAKEGVDMGDLLKVGGFPMRVIGFLPSRGRVFGRSQDDFIVVPLPLFERLYGTKRSLQVGIVTDPDDVPALMAEITGAMRARRKLKPTEGDNFSINQQDMLIQVYKQLTQSLYATAIGLGIITLIVAGVGIMNIMLVAVAERTKEIGIRKALGARPMAILGQFLIEASLVSGLGGFLGTVFGILIAKGLAAATPLPAAVPTAAMAWGVGFGIFVGVTFGLVPAFRASRLLPVEALNQG